MASGFWSTSELFGEADLPSRAWSILLLIPLFFLIKCSNSRTVNARVLSSRFLWIKFFRYLRCLSASSFFCLSSTSVRCCCFWMRRERIYSSPMSLLERLLKSCYLRVPPSYAYSEACSGTLSSIILECFDSAFLIFKYSLFKFKLI